MFHSSACVTCRDHVVRNVNICVIMKDRVELLGGGVVSIVASGLLRLGGHIAGKEASKARAVIAVMGQTPASSVMDVAQKLKSGEVTYAEFAGESFSPYPVRRSDGTLCAARRTTTREVKDVWKWSEKTNGQGNAVSKVPTKTTLEVVVASTLEGDGMWLRDDALVAASAAAASSGSGSADALWRALGYGSDSSSDERRRSEAEYAFDMRIDAASLKRLNSALHPLWRTVSEKFTPAPGGPASVIVNTVANANNDVLPNDTVRGYKEVEEVIPLGRRLYAIGYATLAPSSRSPAYGNELVLVDGDAASIARGAARPFIVAFGSERDVVAEEREREASLALAETWLNRFSASTGLLGVAFFAAAYGARTPR